MRTLIAAVGFTVSLGLAAAGMAQTKTIRIAYSDTESFPNQMGTTAVPADKPGVVVEMMQMAAKELGVELELTRLSNKRVLDGLKDGSIDGAISYSFSKERAEFAKYPMKGDAPDGERRVSTLTYIIYKAKGGGVNWDGKAFQNLDKAIGANSGYSVVGDLKKAGAEVEEANATDINFKKLVATRIAGYAAQDIVADGYLATAPDVAAAVEKVATPFIQKDYFLLFSHQFTAANPELTEAMWTKLGALRTKHEAELLKKYVGG